MPTVKLVVLPSEIKCHSQQVWRRILDYAPGLDSAAACTGTAYLSMGNNDTLLVLSTNKSLPIQSFVAPHIAILGIPASKADI